MRGADLTLGAFEGGRFGTGSRLHRAPAGTKVLSLLGASVLLSVLMRLLPPASSLAVAAGALTGILALGWWGGYRLRRLIAFLLPALAVLVLFLVADALIWFLIPSSRPGAEVWEVHLLQMLAQTTAVLTVVVAARLLVATTRASALIDALTRSTRFLKPLGFRPEVFALTVSIVIRTIPMLAGSISRMGTAHMARGVKPTARSALTPVALSTVATTISTAEALAARMLPAERPTQLPGELRNDRLSDPRAEAGVRSFSEEA